MMAFDGNTASQDSLAVFLSASEHDFVDLAIRILRHDCAPRTISPHRTAIMADGEIAAGQAVFVFNQMPAPAIIASLLFIGWFLQKPRVPNVSSHF
jgi:hypothetical protein